MTELLTLVSGALVGASLGLVGGGGSILATPLLLYVVGIAEPHHAIGTSALCVAVNAAMNAIGHARRGNVRWKPALIFAACGILGAAAGSTLGKMIPGEHLLFLFALLMIGIALNMLHKAHHEPAAEKEFHLSRLAAIALAVGTLSGFFGIGGGFLIVPGLIAATGMPILNAIGSSLVSVTSFGFTTAANYALSGLVVWNIAAFFIAGGFVGGYFGRWLATHLSIKRGALQRLFAALVLLAGIYMLVVR